MNQQRLHDNVWRLIKQLPSSTEEVLPGVQWGRCDELFTPSYWKVQYLFQAQSLNTELQVKPLPFKMGETWLEEVCACLLGGYGIKAEMAFAAFYFLKAENLLVENVRYEKLEQALKTPLMVHGKSMSYRFPSQKAWFLFEFLNRDDLKCVNLEHPLEFRKWLLQVKGIGKKTSAWIVRNWLNSDTVAILDIHIYRAGVIAGFFAPQVDLLKDYDLLEHRFLRFCKAIEVSPAHMDLLIWTQMKLLNKLAINILQTKKLQTWAEAEEAGNILVEVEEAAVL